MPLNSDQLLAVTVSERTMSVMSLMGSLFILGTFTRWQYFRKPINRLVFYASFGNIMANVATMISTSALPSSPDVLSPLCEFQGILVQWFMMADSLWVFCMALNVMLVFFRGYNSRQLRYLEKWYLLFSYGVPFIPALVFIFIDHYGKQRIIGPATIWCWVGPKAEWMRIAFFYVPVWVVICCTLMIYTITGHRIYKRRAVLRSFSRKAPTGSLPVITNPFTAVAPKSIHVQSEVRVLVSDKPSDLSDVEPTCANGSRSSFSSTRNLSSPVESPIPASSTQTRFSRVNWASASSATDEANEQVDVPNCYYKATVSATTVLDLEAAQLRSQSASHSLPHIRRTVAMDGNTAAWGYFKVAFLMFAALFIVWVPSTINRLQQFINRDNPIFGLNLASALVLPLQGFWNAMIYISTTWPECKRAFAEVMHQSSRSKPLSVQDLDGKDSQHTLTSNDTNEFEADIPLSEILKQTLPDPHSRMSSTETMKAPPLS